MSAVNSIITFGAIAFIRYILYNKFFPGQGIDQILQGIGSKIPLSQPGGGLAIGPAGPAPVGNAPMAGNVIGAAGDWDKSSQTQKTVANMQKHGVSFVIAMGDYAYSGSGSSWISGHLAPYKGKFKGAIENHDGDDYLGAFCQSKWTFMHPVNRGLAVVFIDTGRSFNSKGDRTGLSPGEDHRL